MPLYLFPLLLSMLLMAIEKWLCSSVWLVGLWMVLLLHGGVMMAFQGFRVNRAAFRSPTAPLFVLDDVDEAGDTTPTAPKRRLKLVK